MAGILDLPAAGAGKIAAEERLKHQHQRIALDAPEFLAQDVRGYSQHLRQWDGHVIKPLFSRYRTTLLPNSNAALTGCVTRITIVQHRASGTSFGALYRKALTATAGVSRVWITENEAFARETLLVIERNAAQINDALAIQVNIEIAEV